MTICRETPETFTVVALYSFFPLKDPHGLRASLKELCSEARIQGTLILAHEGINGTVSGPDLAIRDFLLFLKKIPDFGEGEIKFSKALTSSFYRIKIHVKNEIVTMGVPGLDPLCSGTYVPASEWNERISDPSSLLIDTRNHYEIALGSFRSALNPDTRCFTEFPSWARENRHAFEKRNVFMFCTGGIRCEKATSYLKSLGIENVFHLKGGILKYLETINREDSLWDGECFVFDQRVSLGHGLAPGQATLCHACRYPLMARDRASNLFVRGVSCPYCATTRSEKDRLRYKERQKQIDLAEKRNTWHIGGPCF